MIPENSVIVLGAGASAPYGFPTGRRLLMKVSESLESEHSTASERKIYQCMTELDFMPGQIDTFKESLLLSNQPSVDAFLECRPEFTDLGKAAIAANIIPHEDPRKMQRQESPDGRWHEYLFQIIAPSPSRFLRDDISFITFNYDRSLEYSLYNSMIHSYGLGNPEATQLLQSIAIHHFYGDLGSFPDAMPFSPDLSAYRIKKAANSLKIVCERNNGPHLPTRLSASLDAAEYIIFLGFGYNETNLKRLFSQSHHYRSRTGDEAHKPKLLGTSHGMGMSEIRQAENWLHQISDQIELVDQDCLTLLREML